jgi:hypothetical protein
MLDVHGAEDTDEHGSRSYEIYANYLRVDTSAMQTSDSAIRNPATAHTPIRIRCADVDRWRFAATAVRSPRAPNGRNTAA